MMTKLDENVFLFYSRIAEMFHLDGAFLLTVSLIVPFEKRLTRSVLSYADDELLLQLG